LKKVIINIVLIFIVCYAIGQNSQETITKKQLSDKLELIITTKYLSDNVRKITYTLNKIENKDTFILMTCLRKDFPNPNIFIDLKNEYLIYEENDYGNNPYIKVMNIENKKNELSTEGFIPIIEKYSTNFYDKENNILFYYKIVKIANGKQTDLMKLNINDLNSEKITTLKSNFEFEYPIIQINSKEKKLIIKYSDKYIKKEYKNEYRY